MTIKPRLVRETPFMLRVEGMPSLGFVPRVYATTDVPIDRATIASLGLLSDLGDALRLLPGVALRDAAFTPDFHKASTVPVGTVLDVEGAVFPGAAGSDIGCGMALASLDIRYDEFTEALPRLRPMLRHAFHQGGRDIAMSEDARARILQEGIAGMSSACGQGGLLDSMTDEDIQAHYLAALDPSLPTNGLWNFDNYVKGSGGLSRDAQIGSLSGGNHFLEFGRVESRIDKAACWKRELHEDGVTILAHNGSVGLGSAVGSHFSELAREAHAKRALGVMQRLMPLNMDRGGQGQAYIDAMGLAANFALVNRVILLWMARDCVSRAIGRPVVMKPVLDSVHNMAWASQEREGWRVLHRKGAAPAPMDRPLVVPGSSGTGTLLFTGLGFAGTHASAPHGSGRVERRSCGHAAVDERRLHGEVLPQEELNRLPRRVADILRAGLSEEAPRAYKPVETVGRTVDEAGMGNPLCRLLPILTIKKA